MTALIQLDTGFRWDELPGGHSNHLQHAVSSCQVGIKRGRQEEHLAQRSPERVPDVRIAVHGANRERLPSRVPRLEGGF